MGAKEKTATVTKIEWYDDINSDPDLTPAERRVAWVMRDHANAELDFEVWVGPKAIAHRLGIHEDTADGARKGLVKKGKIKEVKHGGRSAEEMKGGRGNTKHYRLVIKKGGEATPVKPERGATKPLKGGPLNRERGAVSPPEPLYRTSLESKRDSNGFS